MTMNTSLNRKILTKVLKFSRYSRPRPTVH